MRVKCPTHKYTMPMFNIFFPVYNIEQARGKNQSTEVLMLIALSRSRFMISHDLITMPGTIPEICKGFSSLTNQDCLTICILH